MHDITDALGINSDGQIVGDLVRGDIRNLESHGFFRSPTGSLSIIDVPGGKDTSICGINSTGQMVGNFTGADQKVHSFLRSAADVFTTFDVPNARGTEAYGINDAGAGARTV